MPFLAGRRPTARQMNTIINSGDLFLSPTFNCTTTAYANFTGGSIVFQKLMGSSESDLRVRLDASGFLQASAPVNCTLGVNINSTDYDITYQRFNSIQVHFCWGRFRRITGIPAGTYTIQVRAKNDVASRNVEFTGAGSGGQLGMVVEEILL